MEKSKVPIELSYKVGFLRKGKFEVVEEKVSESFVVQFLEILMSCFSHSDQDVTNVLNAEVSWKPSGAYDMHPFTNGGAGIEKGMVVGTGAVAVENDDYKLGARIHHGTGAGELNYGEQAHSVPVIVAGNVDFVMTRSYQNGSGNAIVVNEIGMLGNNLDGPSAPENTNFLLIRDKLASGFSVPNAETMVVQYTLRTTA